MANVTVYRTIYSSLEKVWESWDDFGAIYKFNPNLTHSHLLEDSRPTGQGAKRQCDLKDGKNWIREEVIEYIPYQQLTLNIYEGTMPLKSAKATLRFRKVLANRTEISMSMDFEPKMGWLGKLMLPMMKPKFEEMLNALLAGNDAFVTQGQLVNAA
ncbi:SRPBCC family protein [Acaryochloris sp. 'Moss Beach']|uniref:SRPBCC family protein n=1 Tax=Acaryochloris sp. 'Moss Beach' TaxID=2740837 RepID=UPI001F2B9D09|nr:SRPBCC family protein [Acaryochloris sp. 'Moss Beach']UJB71112.1 SRPBCC family protein [Acaryochloris sp. 'Moss Beach']